MLGTWTGSNFEGRSIFFVCVPRTPWALISKSCLTRAQELRWTYTLKQNRNRRFIRKFLLWLRCHNRSNLFLQSYPQFCKSETFWFATSSTISTCSLEEDCFPSQLSPSEVSAPWFSWMSPHSPLCTVEYKVQSSWASLSHLHITSNSPLCIFNSFQERNKFTKTPQAALNLMQQPVQGKHKWAAS